MWWSLQIKNRPLQPFQNPSTSALTSSKSMSSPPCILSFIHSRRRAYIAVLYDVDLLFCAFMLACGIKPVLPNPVSLPHISSAPRPPAQLVGVIAVPSIHRGPLSDPPTLALLARLEAEGAIRVTRLESTLAPPSNGAYDDPYLNIAVLDRDLDRAKDRLVEICGRLGIDEDRYPVRDFLADFVRES